jgi:hypothetical protein
MTYPGEPKALVA